MSYECKICGKSCRSSLGLVQHTEASHSRSGVHLGVQAWERHRNQVGEITTGRSVGDYTYEVDDSCYNYQFEKWDCRMCDRSFRLQRQLEQHLKSGVHEDDRYQCQDCYRGFPSLRSLTQHLNSTGHSRREERLVHTLLQDAQRSRTLLLTNGEVQMHFEATLNFD
jgi:hypothetical protein